jgi:hypothetical protein
LTSFTPIVLKVSEAFWVLDSLAISTYRIYFFGIIYREPCQLEERRNQAWVNGVGGH